MKRILTVFSTVFFILLITPSAAQAQTCYNDGQCRNYGNTCDCSFCFRTGPSDGYCVYQGCEGATCGPVTACLRNICQGMNCVPQPTGSGCTIDGNCYSGGQPNPGNPCQFCNPPQNLYGWSNYPNGSRMQECYPCGSGTPGVGICLAGHRSCQNGNMGACEGAFCPQADDCDGVDNNCNNQTDEDFPLLGQDCTLMDGDCMLSGIYICSEDGAQEICSAEAGDDLCDGLDNDCDGGTDEDFPDKGEACSAGLGQCETEGALVCSDDRLYLVCDAVPGTAGNEICDGYDNDCDGVNDNEVEGPLLCNDDNPCTSDVCNELEGCGYEPITDGTPCELSERDGEVYVCYLGQCEAMLEHDVCATALRIEVGMPHHAFLDGYHPTLPRGETCSETEFSGPDIFHVVSLEEGALYDITLTANNATDLAFIVWDGCFDDPICLVEADAGVAGAVETARLSAVASDDHIIQVIVLAAGRERAVSIYSLEIDAVTTSDGDNEEGENGETEGESADLFDLAETEFDPDESETVEDEIESDDIEHELFDTDFLDGDEDFSDPEDEEEETPFPDGDDEMDEAAEEEAYEVTEESDIDIPGDGDPETDRSDAESDEDEEFIPGGETEEPSKSEGGPSDDGACTSGGSGAAWPLALAISILAFRRKRRAL